MTNDDLILALLKESRDAVKELTDAVRKLESGIVGQPNCEIYRGDINRRLVKVEETCIEYRSMKEQTVDTVDLQLAKSEAIDTSNDKYVAMDGRVRVLEDKARLLNLTWKTVWDNSVSKTFVLGGILGLAGIYYGRILDTIALYGWHMVSIGIVAVVILGISIWLAKANNRSTVMGLVK
jgi:hypothetical protein